jgi:hypothetical protein
MENFQQKTRELQKVIETEITAMDQKYKSGPPLYFYEQVLKCRKTEKKVSVFLENEKNVEYIYAALTAWDMNSRAAKMQYFTDFRKSLVDNSDLFTGIENTATSLLQCDPETLKDYFEQVYNKLAIMISGGRLVSTSKVLHFLFPDLVMPMDRTNTLNYFYNNETEGYERFWEIFEFSYAFAQETKETIDWKSIIGKSKWNTTIPKIIDNAIILKMTGGK